MCEFKWTHKGKRMEDMWVMRKLGQELYQACLQPGFELHFIHSNSQTLPDDIYCRCDIYVDVENTKQGTLFALKYPKAKPVS